MMAIETNVTDEAISAAFLNTSFGDRDHRKLLEQGLLKRIAGYHSGYTLTRIMIYLDLLTEKSNITKKGRRFIYAAFNDSGNTG